VGFPAGLDGFMNIRNCKGVARIRLHPEQIARIWARDKATCVYCGAIAQEMDHVIPFQHGGPSRECNMVLSCKKCNQIKWKHLDEGFITKGLTHLARCGMDLSWVDKI
jgi:hypothetical protein